MDNKTPEQRALEAVDNWVKDRAQTVALWDRNGIQSHYREINLDNYPLEIQSEMIAVLKERNLL